MKKESDVSTTSSEPIHIKINKKNFSLGRKSKTIFQNFKLTISPGQFVCILGPSGCGKSTLLRAVAGLDVNFEGKIKIGGECVLGPGRERSLVFQHARLLPWMTVKENIDFAIDRKYSKKQRTAMIDASLQLVGLQHAKDMKIFQLSGGMKTRIALARAIADPPETLLLDEPFSALDFYTRESIHKNITQIQDQHNFTTLMVTHDLDEAIYLSDRIIVLTDPPANIADDISLNFERPYDRSEPAFQNFYVRLLKAMRSARQ